MVLYALAADVYFQALFLILIPSKIAVVHFS